MKSELRQANFSLKKIEKQQGIFLCQPNFLRAANVIGNYFSAPIGQVLKSLIPIDILNNPELLSKKNICPPSDESELKNENLIIQEPNEDRLSIYKGLIRESFAKKESIFLMIPTALDIDFYKNYLEKGIDKYTYAFSSKMKSKEIVEKWKKALSAKEPILIIATPSFLSIPRQDIKTIIVEKESSDTYKQISRPLLDFRKVAILIAKEEKKRLIFGDLALRTETIYYLAKKEYYPLSPPKYRSFSSAKQILIDLTEENQKENILSQEISSIVKNINNEKKSKFFILNNRRGLSSVIYCRDCGQIRKLSLIHISEPTRPY